MRRLLVANRGEIALRIFRACRAEGIETVAVAAPDDRGALHAESADALVEISSYLEAGEHVRAARETGADAVHPGYGFLSESAELAEAVLEAGLTWVGPPPAALRAGGDKLAAKETARAAGVPVLPSGTPEEIGFPLLVKAAAGGGAVACTRSRAAGRDDRCRGRLRARDRLRERWHRRVRPRRPRLLVPRAQRTDPGRASRHGARDRSRHRARATPDRIRRGPVQPCNRLLLARPRGRGAPLCGGSALVPPAGRPARAAAAARGDPRRRGRARGRRDRHRVRPDDREAHRRRRHARRGVRPPGAGVTRDGHRRRHDESSVPPLA